MNKIVKYQHHAKHHFELSGHRLLLPLIDIEEFEFDSIYCYVKMKLFGTLGSFVILRFIIKKENDKHQLIGSLDIIYQNNICQYLPVIKSEGFTLEILNNNEENFYARCKIHCIS